MTQSVGLPGTRTDPLTFAGVSNTSNRFLQALDAGDFDAFVDTFVSDGVWAIRDRPEFQGPDGLRRFWDNRSPKAAHRKHLLNGLCILADDGAVARVEVVISIIDLHDGATVAAGNSTDELRRDEDEVWRFVRKETGMQFKNL
jgi:ketosteroid isomerase-like protein